MDSLSPALKSSVDMADILQNCDLPWPQKFFLPNGEYTSRDKTKSWTDEFGMMKEGMAAAAAGNVIHNVWEEEMGIDRGDGAGFGLLRALRLSQTRAREAEAKASAMTRRSKQIAALMQRESLKLLAHQKWVRLLEVEVALLEEEKWLLLSSSGEGGAGDGEINTSAAAFFFALALCLGVAGVGFAVAYRN